MKKSTIQAWTRMAKAQYKFIGALSIAISSLWIHYTACQPSTYTHDATDIEIYFTPQDPCIDLVVSKILSAKKIILVQAYVITSTRIVHALIHAHQQKVIVKVLIDKNAQMTKGSKVNLLLQHKIPIIIDKTIGLAHNKIMIIDNEYVITGSFNWTDSAQSKNSENIILIKGTKPNQQFKANWHRRAACGEYLKTKK